MKFMGLVLF